MGNIKSTLDFRGVNFVLSSTSLLPQLNHLGNLFRCSVVLFFFPSKQRQAQAQVQVQVGSALHFIGSALHSIGSALHSIGSALHSTGSAPHYRRRRRCRRRCRCRCRLGLHWVGQNKITQKRGGPCAIPSHKKKKKKRKKKMQLAFEGSVECA